MQMLVEACILCARNERHIDIIKQWFDTGLVSDMDGNTLEGVEISTKHRHSLVRRIYTSRLISLEDKQKCLSQLEAIDTTDWMDKTRYFCRSAIPEVEVKR